MPYSKLKKYPIIYNPFDTKNFNAKRLVKLVEAFMEAAKNANIGEVTAEIRFMDHPTPEGDSIYYEGSAEHLARCRDGATKFKFNERTLSHIQQKHFNYAAHIEIHIKGQDSFWIYLTSKSKRAFDLYIQGAHGDGTNLTEILNDTRRIARKNGGGGVKFSRLSHFK